VLISDNEYSDTSSIPRINLNFLRKRYGIIDIFARKREKAKERRNVREKQKKEKREKETTVDYDIA